jgi:hypothetical protein
MKHKHYDMIVAWAEGKEIQVEEMDGTWSDIQGPSWSGHNHYRIKPEPKPDVVKYLIRGLVSNSSWLEFDNQTGYECVKITFDGETGKLKTAEVL